VAVEQHDAEVRCLVRLKIQIASDEVPDLTCGLAGIDVRYRLSLIGNRPLHQRIVVEGIDLGEQQRLNTLIANRYLGIPCVPELVSEIGKKEAAIAEIGFLGRQHMAEETAHHSRL